MVVHNRLWYCVSEHVGFGMFLLFIPYPIFIYHSITISAIECVLGIKRFIPKLQIFWDKWFWSQKNMPLNFKDENFFPEDFRSSQNCALILCLQTFWEEINFPPKKVCLSTFYGKIKIQYQNNIFLVLRNIFSRKIISFTIFG